MSAHSRAWSVRSITGLSVVLGLMLNTASVQAQGTQALAELWPSNGSTSPLTLSTSG